MKFEYLVLIGLFCFRSSVSSLNLECERVTVDRAYVGSTKYCFVRNAVFTTKNSEITSVDYNSHPTTLRGLEFKSQTVNYLPKGLGKFFPDLQNLLIISCKLKSIEKADLEPFKELLIAEFYINQLEKLDGNLFEANTKLRHVNFNDNWLTQVGENILSPLNSLEWAYFQSNPCIHVMAGSSWGIRELKNQLKIECPFRNGSKR